MPLSYRRLDNPTSTTIQHLLVTLLTPLITTATRLPTATSPNIAVVSLEEHKPFFASWCVLSNNESAGAWEQDDHEQLHTTIYSATTEIIEARCSSAAYLHGSVSPNEIKRAARARTPESPTCQRVIVARSSILSPLSNPRRKHR